MPLIENNLPELKAFADAQAGRALEMYKIMKSTFQLIEDIERHEKDCVIRSTGAEYVKNNLVEYCALMDETAAGTKIISNLK